MQFNKKFIVLDNGKPADSKHFPLSAKVRWNNSIFDTFEDANEYLQKWLGQYGRLFEVELNTPKDYSGYGDTIEIREINNANIS